MPTTPLLRVGVCAQLPPSVLKWHRTCACYHNHYELICETFLFIWKVVFLESSTTSSSYNILAPFQEDSQALDEGMLIGMPHVGTSIDSLLFWMSGTFEGLCVNCYLLQEEVFSNEGWKMQ